MRSPCTARLVVTEHTALARCVHHSTFLWLPWNSLSSVANAGEKNLRGFCWCLLQNIFFWGRKSSLCCRRLRLRYGLNSSAAHSVTGITYLVTFGTRNTSGTLGISQRKRQMSSDCDCPANSRCGQTHLLSKRLGISLPAAKEGPNLIQAS